MTPAWIVDQQWRTLTPPAEIRVYGDLPRSPEKLLAASRALHVVDAKRYQPSVVGTWCNIFTADVCGILNAHLDHWFDPDGDGPKPAHEITANELYDNLHALKYPGWSKLGTMASAQAAAHYAGEGKPTIAIFKNLQPKKDAQGRVVMVNGKPALRSGHVVLVVPTPPGARGVYVTGAGGICVQECPIEMAFGSFLSQVEFYAHP